MKPAASIRAASSRGTPMAKTKPSRTSSTTYGKASTRSSADFHALKRAVQATHPDGPDLEEANGRDRNATQGHYSLPLTRAPDT